jgi:hypothetical protein
MTSDKLIFVSFTGSLCDIFRMMLAIPSGSLEFRKVRTHVGQEAMDRGAEVLGQDTNKVWSR